MSEKHIDFKVNYSRLKVFAEYNTKDFLYPVVLSSPHSGRCFPEEFLANARLSEKELRSSEDCFVDDLVLPASEAGIPLIAMNLPRTFVDVSRDKIEIDDSMYFNHPGYDDYPVVGVSWEQATAFCIWRTNLFKQSLALPAGQVVEPFRLPTEGEWEYAARCGKNENKYPWAGDNLVGGSGKGCFLGNFKPGKGNYTEDGHLITSRVGSFAPNEFGLFDMAGNVSEWTSTAYTESGPNQMSDINPELRYNAAKEDPYALKKKVVRGGSWKDVSQFIRSDMRSFEYQNETRSYIGFRCVRTQIGFSKAKGKKK